MNRISEKYSERIPEEGNYKTVIFERKYGVDITNYSTTTEVDRFIESQIGREPGIINSDMKSYDIEGLFDRTIEDIED